MQPQQRADGEKQEDHRKRDPGRNDQRASSLPGIAAGQHALGGVLVQPGIGEVQQHHPGQHGPEAEGGRKAERRIDQLQLVGAVWRVSQRGHGLGRGHRQAGPQEPGHHQRSPDIEHHLHQIAPDHRIEPAHEGEGQAEDQQDQHGHQHVAGRDIKEQDHRDGNGGQVKPRSAGQDPPDQVQRRRRAPGRGIEARLQQLVNRGDARGIEARHQQRADQPGRHQRGEDPADVSEIAAIGEVRHPQESRGRLHGGEDRDRHQPDRRMVPGQEIVLGFHAPLRR